MLKELSTKLLALQQNLANLGFWEASEDLDQDAQGPKYQIVSSKENIANPGFCKASEELGQDAKGP